MQRSAYLAASGVCGVLLLVLVTSVFVFHNFLWDFQIVQALFVTGRRPAELVRICEVITRMGNVETVAGLLVSGAIFSLIVKRFRAIFLLLASEVAVCAGIEFILKHTLSHPAQPDLDGIPKMLASFPSGHSMGSVAFYGLGFYLLSCRFPQHKSVFWVLAIGFALIIGATRVILGVHYLSDVLGGYLIAIPLLLAGIYRYSQDRNIVVTNPLR